MRKVNEAAQAMARKRWKGTTKAQRLAASRHAAAARSRKAAERRGVTLTAATDAASTTIDMSAPPDVTKGNVVRVGPERPASEAQIVVKITAATEPEMVEA